MLLSHREKKSHYPGQPWQHQCNHNWSDLRSGDYPAHRVDNHSNKTATEKVHNPQGRIRPHLASRGLWTPALWAVHATASSLIRWWGVTRGFPQIAAHLLQMHPRPPLWLAGVQHSRQPQRSQSARCCCHSLRDGDVRTAPVPSASHPYWPQEYSGDEAQLLTRWGRGVRPGWWILWWAHHQPWTNCNGQNCASVNIQWLLTAFHAHQPGVWIISLLSFVCFICSSHTFGLFCLVTDKISLSSHSIFIILHP